MRRHRATRESFGQEFQPGPDMIDINQIEQNEKGGKRGDRNQRL
jgi:hypothetical protein